MGDREKKKEDAGKNGTNKDDQQHHQDNKDTKQPTRRRRSSAYSGSYVSDNDSESSGHSRHSRDSRASNDDGHDSDDGYRQPKRKRETRRRKKERTRHGRVTKPRRRTQKNNTRQKRKQTSRFASAADDDPEHTLSITTIMSSKVSTKSSVTVCSNGSYHRPVKQRSTTQMTRADRKTCVYEIIKRMRATCKPCATNRGVVINDRDSDQNDEPIEVDQDDDDEILEIH